MNIYIYCVKTKYEKMTDRNDLEMIRNDKFTRGWVAGACGGLFGGLIGFIPYYIGISSLRLADWFAILIFGRSSPFSFFDEIYALFVLAGSTGFAGILFAYLLPVLTGKNIYFKGWIFFLAPWWLIYLATALAQTQGTLNLSVMTTLSDGVATSIIGIAAVYVYRLLEPKRR